MTVSVVGERHRLAEIRRGDCEDGDCQTVAVVHPHGEPGKGVLLVARYDAAESVTVCGPCDERRMRAWFEEAS